MSSLLKVLIDKGKIIIKDNLIRIPLLAIDYMKSITRKGRLSFHFLKELKDYLFLSEYKDCKLIPLYNAGINENLYYEILLVPNDIKDIEDWYLKLIKKRGII